MANRLDDLRYLHQHDPQDALGVAEHVWQQLQVVFDIDLSGLSAVENVVFAGMGGSALPAAFIASWPGTFVPFELVRDYTVPSYVNSKTLFVASSYSGNTEEVLSALAAAEAAGAQIVVISAGGALATIAAAEQYPLLKIPSGIAPRMSTMAFLRAIVYVLESCDLCKKGSFDELGSLANWLKSELASLRPDVPSAHNVAKELALEMAGTTVIIYSGPKLFPAAHRLKICINESAKNLAWSNQYSEFNHNEFVGWSSHPVEKPFSVVEVRSSFEHERIQKRFDVSERLLSGMRPHPIVVEPHGDTLLAQLLWTVSLGDFTSIYLAFLNGVDPTPIDLVEKLKIELG